MHTACLIQLEARPVANGIAAKQYAGAMVNAWVAGQDLAHALTVVNRELSAEGWLVVEIESTAVVSRDECSTPSARDYFDQCLIDGHVLVLHTWSKSETNTAHAH